MNANFHFGFEGRGGIKGGEGDRWLFLLSFFTIFSFRILSKIKIKKHTIPKMFFVLLMSYKKKGNTIHFNARRCKFLHIFSLYIRATRFLKICENKTKTKQKRHYQIIWEFKKRRNKQHSFLFFRRE